MHFRFNFHSFILAFHLKTNIFRLMLFFTLQSSLLVYTARILDTPRAINAMKIDYSSFALNVLTMSFISLSVHYHDSLGIAVIKASCQKKSFRVFFLLSLLLYVMFCLLTQLIWCARFFVCDVNRNCRLE